MSTNKKTLELLAQELEKVNATLWAPKGGKGVKSKEAKDVGVMELTKIANCLASALNATKSILEDLQVNSKCSGGLASALLRTIFCKSLNVTRIGLKAL